MVLEPSATVVHCAYVGDGDTQHSLNGCTSHTAFMGGHVQFVARSPSLSAMLQSYQRTDHRVFGCARHYCQGGPVRATPTTRERRLEEWRPPISPPRSPDPLT